MEDKNRNPDGTFKEGNEFGRHLKYGTLEALQEAIDGFFVKCDQKEKPYTFTGLALEMGLSRQSLLNYSHKEPFFDTIKAARLKVEAYNEELLIGGRPATGIIFNLKNNFGWEDLQKNENKNDGGLNIKVEYVDGKATSDTDIQEDK